MVGNSLSRAHEFLSYEKKKYLETNILIAKNAYNVFVRDLLGLFGNAKSGTLYGTQSQKSYLFQILANPRY